MNFQRMARFNIQYQYSGPAQIQLLHHTSYATICRHMPYAICASANLMMTTTYDCDYDSIINYQIIDINN